MDYMYELKDMLCKELKSYSENDKLSAGDLEAIDKLTHSIKSIVTIIAMEEGGYSRDGYDGYDRGYSGARYRDDMGRFTSRRYSRDDAKSHMTHELERLMDDAKSKEEREVLQRAMNQLKNM